jgi:hypothetical protein
MSRRCGRDAVGAIARISCPPGKFALRILVLVHCKAYHWEDRAGAAVVFMT